MKIAPFVWDAAKKAQQANNVFKSDVPPAVVTVDEGIFMLWEEGGGIWSSVWNEATGEWSARQQCKGTDNKSFGSKEAPAALLFNKKILMAWNGVGNDGIYYSFYDPNTKLWAPQKQCVGTDGKNFPSFSSPALNLVGDQVLMTWNGTNHRVTYSAYDAAEDVWIRSRAAVDTAGQRDPFNPKAGLSMATIQGETLVMWNLNGFIYYSDYNSNQIVDTWSAPLIAVGRDGNIINSMYPPAVVNAVVKNRFIMAFQSYDQEGALATSIYDSYLPVSSWTNRELCKDKDQKTFIAKNGVSLTTMGIKLFMAWVTKDNEIMYSQRRLF